MLFLFNHNTLYNWMCSYSNCKGFDASEKRSRDSGQPWRVPCDKGKGNEILAFVQIADGLRYSICIIHIKFGPKLIFCKTARRKGHSE